VLNVQTPNLCSPNCPKFRCGKNALQFRGRTAWCRWSEEQCDPTNCNYPICLTRRLLSNGKCGETIKRKTVEKEPEEDTVQLVKVRGKTYRKIGEKEIF
jgi:hypothetical protein